ncbi:MAG: cation:proton antiporter [Gammaproteobacteria bacterium]|nr:cation:proton antiporter [Gammaproteobacteria bacterium]
MAETHELIFQLMVILLAARIFAELAVRVAVPSVIGEIAAGIIIGPSLFGLIEMNQTIQLLGEVGIVLLLFEVGLQTDGAKLLKSGVSSFITAAGGFIIPFVLGFVVCQFVLGYSILVSLFVGGALTATSIGVTIRVLESLRKEHSKVGQVVLGAAVIDDVLGVILLALLFEASVSNQFDIEGAIKIVIFVGTFFLLAPIVAKLMSSLIKDANDSSLVPGLIPTTVMSLVLFFAWVAHLIGAPELLGGFAAGLALSRRFFLPFGLAIKTDQKFASQIDLEMKPIARLFVPLFFVSVGLSVDLSMIDWSSMYLWLVSGLLFVVAVVGKMAGAFLVNAPISERIATGLAMTPRGEVGLIFIELGRSSNILNNEIYVAMLLVIVLTTIVPPFVLKWYYANNEQLKE